MLTLSATVRGEVGKGVSRLLSLGNVPAIVYGPKEKATPITLIQSEFTKVLKQAGESTVIELAGLGKSMQVLIHEVVLDPLTSLPRHVDLYAIEKGAKVEVALPLSFINESPAVKTGASLVKVLHELEVEAAPADLPHDITVDLSVLTDIGSQICVSDLSIPHGVSVKAEPDQVVVLVQELTVEVEEPVAAPDMSAIEVEKKGKTEEEEPA